MENKADKLMLSGVVGFCPDCAENRILVTVAETEYCCTDCDGAVFLLDTVGATALLTRLAS